MPVLLIVLLVLLSALTNVMGGWLVTRKQYTDEQICRIVAVTAGFLLAITLIDWIPESMELSELSPYWILLGFVFMIFIYGIGHKFVRHPEALDHHHEGHLHSHAVYGRDVHAQVDREESFGNPTVHRHEHRSGSRSPSQRVTVIGIQTAMMIQTFFDGFSIAAAYLTNTNIGFLVFVAVILHKIPDGMTMSSVLLSRTGDYGKAFMGSLKLGVSTMVGGLIMLLIYFTKTGIPQDLITASALAFSAGIFLYITAADLIPEVFQTRHRSMNMWIILGILVFFVMEGLYSLISH